MKSILEKLYYGELSPCSLPTPNSEKYFQAKKDNEEIGTEILEKYPDCNELLEKYTNAILTAASCESLQDFERGFRIGVLITLDVMTIE